VPLLGVEAAIAAGDGEAGREPLEIPLERTRKRLVEVIDAEHEPPVRRREHTEVRQVRVAAQLHLQIGSRHVLEIGRHQLRGAPEERERRHEHAPVADRHELGDARQRLLLELLDRIAARGRRLPLAVHAPSDLRPPGLPPRGTFGHRRVLDRAAVGRGSGARIRPSAHDDAHDRLGYRAPRRAGSSEADDRVAPALTASATLS
jgi:hypothetical protein